LHEILLTSCACIRKTSLNRYKLVRTGSPTWSRLVCTDSIFNATVQELLWYLYNFIDININYSSAAYYTGTAFTENSDVTEMDTRHVTVRTRFKPGRRSFSVNISKLFPDISKISCSVLNFFENFLG